MFSWFLHVPLNKIFNRNYFLPFRLGPLVGQKNSSNSRSAPTEIRFLPRREQVQQQTQSDCSFLITFGSQLPPHDRDFLSNTILDVAALVFPTWRIQCCTSIVFFSFSSNPLTTLDRKSWECWDKKQHKSLKFISIQFHVWQGQTNRHISVFCNFLWIVLLFQKHFFLHHYSLAGIQLSTVPAWTASRSLDQLLLRPGKKRMGNHRCKERARTRTKSERQNRNSNTTEFSVCACGVSVHFPRAVKREMKTSMKLTNSESKLQNVMLVMLSWRALKSKVLAIASTSAAAAMTPEELLALRAVKLIQKRNALWQTMADGPNCTHLFSSSLSFPYVCETRRRCRCFPSSCHEKRCRLGSWRTVAHLALLRSDKPTDRMRTVGTASTSCLRMDTWVEMQFWEFVGILPMLYICTTGPFSWSVKSGLHSSCFYLCGIEIFTFPAAFSKSLAWHSWCGIKICSWTLQWRKTPQNPAVYIKLVWMGDMSKQIPHWNAAICFTRFSTIQDLGHFPVVGLNFWNLQSLRSLLHHSTALFKSGSALSSCHFGKHRLSCLCFERSLFPPGSDRCRCEAEVPVNRTNQREPHLTADDTPRHAFVWFWKCCHSTQS